MTAPDPASRLARLAAQPLYVISTLGPGDSADQELWALRQAVEGGARLIQLRVKPAGANATPGPAAASGAHQAAATAARRAWLGRCRDALPDDVLLIVNDDLEAVFDADGAPLADGVHLGRADAAALADSTAAGLALARQRLGSELLLGTSTRTLDELDAALAAGADHAGFGAMAVSTTKSDTQAADPEELRLCVAAHSGVPLFAIGGLGPDNLWRSIELGCRRAAVGAAILRADDPAAAAAACLAALTVTN